MKAVMYEAFNERPKLVGLPDPAPEPHGVVLKVEATGVCRSDWHGWVGHDTDIELPHVPGHELAGVIVATGKDVTKWKANAMPATSRFATTSSSRALPIGDRLPNTFRSTRRT